MGALQIQANKWDGISNSENTLSVYREKMNSLENWKKARVKKNLKILICHEWSLLGIFTTWYQLSEFWHRSMSRFMCLSDPMLMIHRNFTRKGQNVMGKEHGKCSSKVKQNCIFLSSQNDSLVTFWLFIKTSFCWFASKWYFILFEYQWVPITISIINRATINRIY